MLAGQVAQFGILLSAAQLPTEQSCRRQRSCKLVRVLLLEVNH